MKNTEARGIAKGHTAISDVVMYTKDFKQDDLTEGQGSTTGDLALEPLCSVTWHLHLCVLRLLPYQTETVKAA